MTAVTITAVGALAVLEDRGRTGYAHLGVGRAGAADRGSYELANRLVGNLAGATCIETTLGMLELSADRAVLMSVTGAPVEVRCGRRICDVNSSFRVPPRTTVVLGRPRAGLRNYVAVRGGLIGRSVLGSPSWDTMAQLGHPPLAPGDVVGIGDAAGDSPATDFAAVAAVGTGPLDLPLILGPRDDWFTAEAIDRLRTHDFTVSSDTDRVGARLDGPSLPRHQTGELASEGVVLGALQVPTRGRPTIFLADHPVTGGYPVVGVVPRPWVDQVSQAAPGVVVRFRPRRAE